MAASRFLQQAKLQWLYFGIEFQIELINSQSRLYKDLCVEN